MTDKQLEILLDKYCNAQDEANLHYGEIIEELDKRKLMNQDDVLSCMNSFETLAWKELVLKLINKDKED